MKPVQQMFLDTSDNSEYYRLAHVSPSSIIRMPRYPSGHGVEIHYWGITPNGIEDHSNKNVSFSYGLEYRLRKKLFGGYFLSNHKSVNKNIAEILVSLPIQNFKNLTKLQPNDEIVIDFLNRNFFCYELFLKKYPHLFYNNGVFSNRYFETIFNN